MNTSLKQIVEMSGDIDAAKAAGGALDAVDKEFDKALK
jgi:hypothetical protein